jgi:glycosyltransferase involved in cell wall biosynthesis
MNTARYAHWMRELGHRVIVYCVGGSPLHREVSNTNLEIRIVRRNRKYFDWPNARRVAKRFAKDGIELCWFRDTRDMDTLGWAKRFSFGKFSLLYQQAMQFGVSKRDPFHTFRFRPIDAWVSTLEFLKSQVVESTSFDAGKIHVVPLGVDAERLFSSEGMRHHSRDELHLADDAFMFGLIGRLDPLKGQHMAVQALGMLHEQGARPHLLLVGEATRNEGDAYVNQLHEMIRKSNLEAFVHWRPYNADVSVFYNSIDAFLLCSKGETFGTVTIEAMACALPIIGTRSSGTPEILSNGDCGLLVNPEEAHQLAEAMLQVMNHREESNAMGRRAKVRFDAHYSKSSSVQGMNKIVCQLLRKD